jgi:hypothetical protein
MLCLISKFLLLFHVKCFVVFGRVGYWQYLLPFLAVRKKIIRKSIFLNMLTLTQSLCQRTAYSKFTFLKSYVGYIFFH